MRIAGSNRYLLQPSEKKTLAWMAKDVEDGDISDADSLEEITAEDFRRDARRSTSRVLVPDPLSRNLASDPNSFAPPQAVRNKPLGSDGMSAGSAGPAAKTACPDSEMEEPCVVVIEDSSEDSFSEAEGEIEVDSESVAGGIVELEEELEVKESEEKQLEVMCGSDNPLNLILEDLATITAENVEISLNAVRSQLQKSFETMKQMFSESRVPTAGSLVQQALMGIQTAHAVINSRNLMKRDQNEVLLLRLLLHIKDQYSVHLTPDQMKEIDVMVQYWVSDSEDKGLLSGSGINMNGVSSHGFISSEKPFPEPRPVDFVVSSAGKAGLSKLETPIVARNRVEFNRLLDLHADFNEGNLPSPTRENAPALVMQKPVDHGMGAVIATHPIAPKNREIRDGTFNTYDNRAFRAVSSYHQKHSRTSFLASNGLPSPTPSEECDAIDDSHGEVSSSWTVHDDTTLNSGVTVIAKSRDPRLKILNSEVGDPNRSSIPVDSNAPNRLSRELVASKKHKAVDDAQDDHILKRPKNGYTNSGDVRVPVRRGGRLEKSSVAASELSDVCCLNGDVESISMKPRDPCDVFLQSNTVQKGESLKSEPTKESKELFIVRDQGEQAETACLASHPTPQPDIARLFTKNLKNKSRRIRSKTTTVDVKSFAADSDDQKTASALPCEGGTKSASHAPAYWEDVDRLLDGYDDQQRAAIRKERARRIEEQNKMFADRKLCLVLDLDHTLLNSAKFEDVDAVQEEKLKKREEKERNKPQRHLFCFQHMGMWTKLRPGIWNFLERASKLYELHLYTMGNKLYATEMAKAIDPTGNLFAGRVISRGDAGDALECDKIKDLDGVLGMESAVVIIDDSVRVWPHNKLNLIVVERYTYFPCSRRQFGLRGPSLLEIGHDERAEDGTLASSLAVIERIHLNFFSHRSLKDADVRNMLAAEQLKVLAGCRIVFSRIFPLGEANPHQHPLWRTAQQFGAVCTNQIDELVTHVVANSPGTDKVNWAISAGRFVVKPGWVEASALLFRRASEHNFAVKL